MMQQSLIWCALLGLSMVVAAVDSASQNTAKANALTQQSLAEQAASDRGFYPHYLGQLVDVQNAGVRGQVYIVNSTTIQIQGFTLPMGPPAPLFWIDYHHLLSGQGVHLPSEKYGFVRCALTDLLIKLLADTIYSAHIAMRMCI